MPNHCTNILEIDGDAETIERIREVLDDREREDEALTFEGLLPRPEALKGIKYGRSTIGGKTVKRWKETEDSGRVPITEAETKRLREKHGGADLLEWSRAHWGTKWNSYWSELEEEGDESLRYRFTTAWGPPDQFVAALREAFPKATIQLHFREPNMGMAGTL